MDKEYLWVKKGKDMESPLLGIGGKHGQGMLVKEEGLENEGQSAEERSSEINHEFVLIHQN